MEISWHGFSCVSIYGKNGTVVIDPYDPGGAGIKLPKLKASIVLSNEAFSFHRAVSQVNPEDGDLKIFDWPGEYESKDIHITAIRAFDTPKSETEKGAEAHEVLIFVLEVDGFKICHLSNLGHKLTNEMTEAIGDIDILLVPVGGNGRCLDASKAHEVIEQIDPRLVIPMYYDTPGSKIPLQNLDAFLTEVGMRQAKREKGLKLKSRSELPQEHTEYVVLERE